MFTRANQVIVCANTEKKYNFVIFKSHSLVMEFCYSLIKNIHFQVPTQSAIIEDKIYIHFTLSSYRDAMTINKPNPVMVAMENEISI